MPPGWNVCPSSAAACLNSYAEPAVGNSISKLEQKMIAYVGSLLIWVVIAILIATTFTARLVVVNFIVYGTATLAAALYAHCCLQREIHQKFRTTKGDICSKVKLRLCPSLLRDDGDCCCWENNATTTTSALFFWGGIRWGRRQRQKPAMGDGKSL